MIPGSGRVEIFSTITAIIYPEFSEFYSLIVQVSLARNMHTRLWKWVILIDIWKKDTGNLTRKYHVLLLVSQFRKLICVHLVRCSFVKMHCSFCVLKLEKFQKQNINNMYLLINLCSIWMTYYCQLRYYLRFLKNIRDLYYLNPFQPIDAVWNHV